MTERTSASPQRRRGNYSERSDPRILILHASVGTGHARAAQAIQLAVQELCPQARVSCVDVLELANVAFRKVYGGGYVTLADSAPHLLGYLYDRSDRSDGSFADSVRRFFQTISLRAFRKFLMDGAWDVVISTHFLPAEIIAHLKRNGSLTLLHAVAVTDFDAHRFWANLPCEHFFVATIEGSSSLRYWGVPEDAITVTGIPIHPVFGRLPDRETALRAHGLSGDRPVLLQLAGGFGMGPIGEIYRGLLELKVPVEVVVVSGRNDAARRQLLQVPVPKRHRAHIFGYTQKMHELMAASTIVISKPGGLTTAETLACGVPMAVVNPIPGQESRNCDYLLEEGAGIKINGIPSISTKLAALLKDPERLATMRSKAWAIGKPGAAFEISRKISEIVTRRSLCLGLQALGLQPVYFVRERATIT